MGVKACDQCGSDMLKAVRSRIASAIAVVVQRKSTRPEHVANAELPSAERESLHRNGGWAGRELMDAAQWHGGAIGERERLAAELRECQLVEGDGRWQRGLKAVKRMELNKKLGIVESHWEIENDLRMQEWRLRGSPSHGPKLASKMAVKIHYALTLISLFGLVGLIAALLIIFLR